MIRNRNSHLEIISQLNPLNGGDSPLFYVTAALIISGSRGRIVTCNQPLILGTKNSTVTSYNANKYSPLRLKTNRTTVIMITPLFKRRTVILTGATAAITAVGAYTGAQLKTDVETRAGFGQRRAEGLDARIERLVSPRYLEPPPSNRLHNY